jgi:cell division septation protein DedD
MDSALKQRLIGAAVLVALAMIFLPMLLRSPDPTVQDAAQVPLDAPAAPDQEFETREVPLMLPTPSPASGADVTGAAAPSGDATVVVDPDEAAPRQDFDPDAPADAPLDAIDPATGEPVAALPEPAAADEADADADTALPTAPLPVATAGGKYAVNVGSFSNLANARALADRLRAQGLPLTSESVDVGGKPAMRLRVGPYAERALAEAARLRIESVAGSAATVIALDAAPAAAAPASAPSAPAASASVPSAPAVSAPAPATRPAAAAGVGFAVQLGALSSEADANMLVGRAKAAGFVAFHQRVQTERGAVWRVRVGPEADRAAAQRLRDDVAAKLGVADAIVVSHP